MMEYYNNNAKERKGNFDKINFIYNCYHDLDSISPVFFRSIFLDCYIVLSLSGHNHPCSYNKSGHTDKENNNCRTNLIF